MDGSDLGPDLKLAAAGHVQKPGAEAFRQCLEGRTISEADGTCGQPFRQRFQVMTIVQHQPAVDPEIIRQTGQFRAPGIQFITMERRRQTFALEVV